MQCVQTISNIAYETPFIRSANNDGDNDGWPVCLCQWQWRRQGCRFDDPVTDINHQKLLYTIFGSLHRLNARQYWFRGVWVVAGCNCTAHLFNAHVWRSEQSDVSEWFIYFVCVCVRVCVALCRCTRLLSIYSMMHSGNGHVEGRFQCISIFHERPSRQTNEKLNGNLWLDRKREMVSRARVRPLSKKLQHGHEMNCRKSFRSHQQ